MINFSFKLPYPLLASLNGVALFAQSQDVTLLTTLTKDCKLLWRDYQNRYLFIKNKVYLVTIEVEDVSIYSYTF